MPFNPNQPFEVVEQPASAGGFDPNAPFEIVEDTAVAVSPEEARRLYGEIAQEPMATGFAPIQRRIPNPEIGVALDTGARAARTIGSTTGQIVQGLGRLTDLRSTPEQELARTFGADTRNPVSRFLGDEGRQIERESQEFYGGGIDAARDHTLLAQGAEMGGSLIPIVASGGYGAPLAGGLLMGEQGARQAELEGRDANRAFLVNAVPGALINAAPAVGIARANPAISRIAQGELARRGLRAGVGALEGAAVNTLGDAGIQLADSGYIDRDRTLANIAIGAGAGGTIGASMRSAADAAPIARAQQAAPELDLAAARNQYNQAIELETADALQRNLELQDQRTIEAQIADQIAARELGRPEFQPQLEDLRLPRDQRQLALEDAFSAIPSRSAADAAETFLAAGDDLPVAPPQPIAGRAEQSAQAMEAEFARQEALLRSPEGRALLAQQLASESIAARVAPVADEATLAREAALVDAEMAPDIPENIQVASGAQRVADKFEGQFSGSRSRQFRNRQRGSIDPAVARSLGGGAVGAAYGYATGDTQEERVARAAGFGLGGAALAGAAPAIGRALSRGDAAAPRRMTGIDLEARPSVNADRVAELAPVYQDVVARNPDVAAGLNGYNVPVEIRNPDGSITPAVMSGWVEASAQDFGGVPGEYILRPSIGRNNEAAGGFSDTALPPGYEIITPIPDYNQWQQGVQGVRSRVRADNGPQLDVAARTEPELAPIEEGISIEPIGMQQLVLADAGFEPEMQYQVRRPGEEGRGVTMTASQLREQGIPIPEATNAQAEASAPGNAAGVSALADPVAGINAAADLNFALPERPGTLSRAVAKAADLTKAAGRGLDEYVGVMDTRVRNISPEAYGALQQYEFNTRNTANIYKADVEPFYTQANKLLNADDQRRLTVFLNDGKFDAVAALIADRGKTNPEAVASALQAFAQSRSVFEDLIRTAQDAGVATGVLDNYWHRQLDPRYKKEFLDKIGHKEKGPIMEAITQKAEQLGIEPEAMSISDRADIANQVLRGVNFAMDGGVPGQLKARGIKSTQPFEKYYLPYDQSALAYVDKMVRYIERKKLFGNGVDNAGSLGNAIERTREIDGLTSQQETDLRDMFKDRFTKGEQASGPILGSVRKAMSVAYLGQVSDAVTQVADFILNPGRYGIVDSLGGTFGKNEITAKDIGLDEIGQEIKSAGGASKLIDFVFKTTGFKKVVQAAQNASLNTSIRALRRLSNTPDGQIILANKYGRAFEAEFPQMMDDLQNGRITPNTRLLAFTELTGSQPITLSSMPQGYLRHPNGRVLYAMKSFAVKSLDLFRREAIGTFNDGRKQWAAGNKKEGMVLMKRGARNLAGIAAAYAVGGAITNVAKDALAGRETDPEELAAGSVLGLVGLSRYDIQNLLKNGPGDAIRDKIMPAYGFADEAASFVMSGGDDDRIKQRLPWIGDLWYWRGDSGREREQQSRDRRARENDPTTQRRKEIRDRRKDARERE